MDVLRPELKQKYTRRRRVITAVVTLILLTAITWAVIASTDAGVAHASQVSVGSVKQGEFVRDVRGSGKLVASEQRWIVARNEANVQRIVRKPGESVTADSVILELVNPEVSGAFLAADAAYQAARGDHAALVAKLQSELLDLRAEQASRDAEYQMALVDEEAYRHGVDSGVIAKVEYRKAKIASEQRQRIAGFSSQRVTQLQASIRAQMQSSEARLEQFARTRTLREVEAQALQVAAGIGGVVLSVEVEEGQRVPAGTKLARVAQPSKLIAEIRVPESQAAGLARGQAAMVNVDGVRVPGKVRRIDPMVSGGTLLVEIDLAGELPAGSRSEQSIEAEIRLDRIANALYVDRPMNAQAKANGTVFRLTGAGAAERVPVRFGEDSVNRIQVLAGLRAGDRIILSDTSKFDGASKLEFN